MANAENNPRPLADAGLIGITANGVFRIDDTVQSFDVSDEGSVTSVPGPNGIIGTSRGAGGFSLSITRPTLRDNSAVDYEALRADDQIIEVEFLIGFYEAQQFIPVRSRKYSGCRVANVGSGLAQDGTTTENVTITAPFEEITRLV